MVHQLQLLDSLSMLVSTLTTLFYSRSWTQRIPASRNSWTNKLPPTSCRTQTSSTDNPSNGIGAQTKNLSVHVSQQSFSEHTSPHFGLKDCNRIPLMTPYRSGCLINSIPDPDLDNPDLPKRKAIYQSICGSVNWLTISTRPDTDAIMSFLASYHGATNHGHYKATLHIWELPGKYRDFILVMVFYLFCWRTKRILVTAITGFKIYILIHPLMLLI